MTIQIKQNQPLKGLSYWKVGGKADYFCSPKTPEELKQCLQWAKENHQPISVLGGGTNVLISDQGVEGLVISTAKLNQLWTEQTKTNLFIHCFAGVLKSKLMRVFKSYELAPAVFLAGLPGDIGGGIVMNAGINPKQGISPNEFSEITESFFVMQNAGSVSYKKEDIKWGYRKSSGWQKKNSVIYKACFKWPLKKEKKLHEQVTLELKKRRDTQPLSEPSCGCVFKNPYPKSAGLLIEKCGLKGLKKGGAQISNRHGNFIVNLGDAKAKDIDDLIQTTQQTVSQKLAINLELEIHYMGRWNNEKIN